MIKVIDHQTMGRSERGWLHSTFHFSFAEYFNPDNIQFGALRVVNDDTIDPYGGFPTHPHENMEIVTYVIDGKLTHADSMGNTRVLERGQVQYMSAGTGITHSEFNNIDEPLRLLQIWILPDRAGHMPNYGDHLFEWVEREGKWLHIVSSKQGHAPIRINQDMDISVISVQSGERVTYELQEGRQAYVIQIEGAGLINGHEFKMRDAAEVTDESDIELVADSPSHYLLLDMVKQ